MTAGTPGSEHEGSRAAHVDSFTGFLLTFGMVVGAAASRARSQPRQPHGRGVDDLSGALNSVAEEEDAERRAAALVPADLGALHDRRDELIDALDAIRRFDLNPQGVVGYLTGCADDEMLDEEELRIWLQHENEPAALIAELRDYYNRAIEELERQIADWSE